MPELPDVSAYIAALGPRIVGTQFETVRIASPFLLRTAVPAVSELAGREVRELRRLADRALSRLLGSDWPRTLDELETLKRQSQSTDGNDG